MPTTFLRSHLTTCALGLGGALALVGAPGRPHAAPVVDAHPMATQPGCPANVGTLDMSVDVFGAFGSGVAGAGDAIYDPIDNPNTGAHGTVFEAMTFLCTAQGGVATGNWMERARQVDVPYAADGTPNHMTSRFTLNQLEVALDARLDCNVLTLCYTMTNRTGARLDDVVIFPYVDGDLFFNGRFNNDYAATNAGRPRTVYEFDQGDDPAAPTTYLALFGPDAADARLTGWETAQYNEGQARIQDTFSGCNTLRGDLTRRVNADADLDGNLVTDAGFDVSLALRFSAGALANGATSPAMCFNVQWGQGRQCSDEDHDDVCVPEDNCPADANPDQRDTNGNGIGDACEIVCMPVPEVCNAVDDDCDGVADDNLGLGNVCSVGLGACERGGTNICGGGGAVVCSVVAGAPGVEVCNAVDDDCDGVADDNLGLGNACSVGLGACERAGTNICGAGGAVVCSVAAGAPVPEVCNALDDDCDGLVDNLAAGAACLCRPGDSVACYTGPAGTAGVGPCAAGMQVCRADSQGYGPCQGESLPGAETCNGLDDDCDGLADDTADRGAPCREGAGACTTDGRLACDAASGTMFCEVEPPAPAPEVCNGLDDDCDGAVDDVDAVEICNGLDDDCDGETDEDDPGGGGRCETDRPGRCADGREACRDGALVCVDAPEPVAETCNGLDDDCDGEADEALGQGERCDSGEPGVCAEGLLVCEGGAVVCRAQAEPTDENCDGLDNDCDGAVDDEVAGTDAPCGTGEAGVCREGRRGCVSGAWACLPDPERAPGDEACNLEDDDCDGVRDDGLRNACGFCGPLAGETCDGTDEDCDGEVDDDARCPAPRLCALGRCVDPCVNNECGDDLRCIGGACLTPCDLVECAPGEGCRNGLCFDPCVGVACGAGERCVAGECGPDACERTGCPDGEVCVGLACRTDPCAEVECEAEAFCRDGTCVQSCAPVACPWGLRCVDGECEAEPCAEIRCADGERCVEGVCGAEPCRDVRCCPGEACLDGLCVSDPCAGIRCPGGERCELQSGLAQCVADWAPLDDADADSGDEADAFVVDAAGLGTLMDAPTEVPTDVPTEDRAADSGSPRRGPAGGCGCRATNAAGSSGIWLLLLAVVGYGRRRNRGR